MSFLTEVNEINRHIFNLLVENSQLAKKFVLNANVDFGETLNLMIEQDKMKAIAKDQCVILFYLDNNNNAVNVSYQIEDGYIYYTNSYNVNVIIYGDNSMDLANKLVARLRSEANRISLNEKGIHVVNITTPSMINEFKNNLLWKRQDFTINVACEFKIQEAISSYEINDLELIIGG